MLKSFSLKDIRTLKNRRKRENREIARKNSALHPTLPGKVPPIKYIDPFQYHRIVSDIIIIEEMTKMENEYFSALRLLIELKHIAEISFNEDFVFAKFENSSHYPYSPLDLVVSRLRSLGEQSAFDLAADILEYKELCLLIKNTKQFGITKEILSTFSPKYLNFLKEYFKSMMSTTINVEQLKSLLAGVLENNKKNLVFFLIYDEYKEYLGTQLCGVGVNDAMRRLIGWNELEICHKNIWCVETKDYYLYIHKMIDELVNVREADQKLFINTKFGYFSVVFEVRRYFVTNDSKKMVFVICIAREITSLQDGISPSLIEAFLDKKDESNPEKSFTPDHCQKNQTWNRLIDSYFDFQHKKK